MCFYAGFWGLIGADVEAGERVFIRLCTGGKWAEGAGLWKQAFVMAVWVGIAELIRRRLWCFGVISSLSFYMTRYDKRNQTVLLGQFL